jgi:DNA-directed RNA polymerase subunit RPC12/RpoP
MIQYKCPNCGKPVSKSFLLCDEYKAEAVRVEGTSE